MHLQASSQLFAERIDRRLVTWAKRCLKVVVAGVGLWLESTARGCQFAHARAVGFLALNRPLSSITRSRSSP